MNRKSPDRPLSMAAIDTLQTVLQLLDYLRTEGHEGLRGFVRTRLDSANMLPDFNARDVEAIDVSKLSKQVASVEKLLGFQLLQRRKNSPVTISMEALVQQAYELMQRMVRTKEDLLRCSNAGVNRPSLSFGSFVSVINQLGPFVAAAVIQEFPQIDLCLYKGMPQDLLSGVKSGSLDVTLTVARSSDEAEQELQVEATPNFIFPDIGLTFRWPTRDDDLFESLARALNAGVRGASLWTEIDKLPVIAVPPSPNRTAHPFEAILWSQLFEGISHPAKGPRLLVNEGRTAFQLAANGIALCLKTRPSATEIQKYPKSATPRANALFYVHATQPGAGMCFLPQSAFVETADRQKKMPSSTVGGVPMAIHVHKSLPGHTLRPEVAFLKETLRKLCGGKEASKKVARACGCLDLWNRLQFEGNVLRQETMA